MSLPTRAEAFSLVEEYTENLALIRHMLAVEAAMRAYARYYGADEELWGIAGLVHDFDYERWPSPETHPLKGADILRAKGYPEAVIHAVLGHANYLQHLAPRQSLMDKALYACDELCGLITAVTYVRPGKSLAEVNLAAVRKKMKDKRFAANVNREDIAEGAAELGRSLDEHIEFVIAALQPVAKDLGLDGSGV